MNTNTETQTKAPVATRVWNAVVRRAWYAFDCPPNFPLRQIR